MLASYTDILCDVIKTIDTDYSNVPHFYDEVLKKVSSLFDYNFAEIYFINNGFFEKKASSLHHDTVMLNPSFYEILEEKKETTFFIRDNDFYNIFSKFEIKGSLFGFAFIQTDKKPDEEKLKILDAYIKIYSYLIKDYELSQVFKAQLEALSNAVVEKKEANRFIESQNKKLKELDGIKNDFLSSVTHELRTPLNAIIGFSQALGSGIFGELNSKQSEYIKDIQASGVHLLNMINEILDFSKIESKAVKFFYSEFEPNTIISEIVNILMPLSDKKHIDILIEPGYKGTIYTDCQKFQQIIYNLLSNAIKFTRENGKIIIRTSYKSDKFIMEFEDNGIGIEKKYHKKIFEKFIYLNNIHSPSECSTGLGLSITKELVKMLKGKIILESKINVGSKFIVELPTDKKRCNNV